MTIYIIRHAEPDYARDSLTEKGWREAELLSHRLAKIPDASYYVSPLAERATPLRSRSSRREKPPRSCPGCASLTQATGPIL